MQSAKGRELSTSRLLASIARCINFAIQLKEMSQTPPLRGPFP